MAREGVRHDIIAPKKTIKTIVQSHMEEEDIGRSYYDQRADWKVASVDTIIRRELNDNWLRQVGLGFQDEGHHVLRDNKWGKAAAMFPNARWILPTATPIRGDGKGLGAHADGIADAMVVGPGMRWLIDNGHLTDYHLIAPTTRDFSMVGVEISPVTGDFNLDQMRKRVKSSTTIVGDVVASYLKFAAGKLGITFAVDVEHATQIAAEYNRCGVPAAVVHAETLDHERNTIMRKFKNRELLQLVNVDLFGEGVDVPACEVVSMARPTASFSLYAQQFGRALRLLVSRFLRAAWHTYTSAQRLQFIAESEKPKALIIDHVGNFITHGGPPDRERAPWSLDARDRRKKATDGIPMRACANPICLQAFERIYPCCPHCGWEPPIPAERGSPAQVDGDMILYSQELLDELFGAIRKVDGPPLIPQNITEPAIVGAIKKNHRIRQEVQQELRQAMNLVMPPTLDERVAQRKFFDTFGVDTLTAQGLGSAEAGNLRQRILEKVGVKG